MDEYAAELLDAVTTGTDYEAQRRRHYAARKALTDAIARHPWERPADIARRLLQDYALETTLLSYLLDQVDVRDLKASRLADTNR